MVLKPELASSFIVPGKSWAILFLTGYVWQPIGRPSGSAPSVNAPALTSTAAAAPSDTLHRNSLLERSATNAPSMPVQNQILDRSDILSRGALNSAHLCSRKLILTPSHTSPLRIALFTDSFGEANGVATLSRHMAEFARDRKFPFLLVHGGTHTRLTHDGSLQTLELKRGFAKFRADAGLYCDPLLSRFKALVTDQLRAFRPDVVHITGPGDLGFLGLWTSHVVKVPLVASWHTNLHEYAGRRLDKALNFLPGKWRRQAVFETEKQSLRGLLRFYRTARFVLAPNRPLIDLLHRKTGKPAFFMAHGVDLEAYAPAVQRNPNRPFCIGYVGRMTTEKNVCYFPQLEKELFLAGERNFRFLLVGDGGQRKWLKKNLKDPEMPGVLRGSELAAAYGRMDAFVFPSRTDTFGLVVLEAMASGLPVIIGSTAGANVGIEDGVSGLLEDDFAKSLVRLIHDEPLRAAMGRSARRLAASHSWRSVFEQLYQTYADGLTAIGLGRVAEPVYIGN